MTRRKILKRIGRFLNKVSPRNRFGDRVVALWTFVNTLKRLPRRNGRQFNDIFYRIKTGSEIDDPLRQFTSDKEFVKFFVSSVIGEQRNVGTVAVLRSADEVDDFDFPPRCAIKPTQASGIAILRRDNEPVDRQKIRRWFEVNYYDKTRERNYKNLKPKVIVEPLVFDSDNPEDFKFYCYGGKAKYIQVDFDRATNHTQKFYDPAWTALEFSINYPRSDKNAAKPACLDDMIAAAEALASYFGLVRIDFYCSGDDFRVGEITHCSWGAMGIFESPELEAEATRLLLS